MGIRVIALGNVLMGDDAIGIRIAEGLIKQMENKKIQIIICETDIEFCLYQIEDGDLIFIIDAANNNKKPGTISLIPFSNHYNVYKFNSQHGLKVLDLLYLHNKRINGYIIEIEIGEVALKLELSNILTENFNRILNDTKNLIEQKLFNQLNI